MILLSNKRKKKPLKQMELHFPSTPLLLSSLLFIFILFKIAKKPKSKLPPGPWKLPLLGNMHQLALSGSLPHHTLRKMAEKYGPLMHLKLGEVSTVIVTSPEIAKEVFKAHDIIFASRPSFLMTRIISYNTKNLVSAPYGEYWRQMRKICVVELLSPKRVQTFRGIREEEVSNLINSISKERVSPINLSKEIFSLTYGVVCRAAFGRKSIYQAEFVSAVEETMTLAAGFNLVEMYPSVKLLEVVTGYRRTLERMHEKLDKILQYIVSEHREKKKPGNGKGEAEEGEDLVDVLLRIQKNGELPLSDDNIKAVILDIFSAGSETSSTIVEWAMSELLKNPQLMKRAQDEVRNVFHKKGNVDEASLQELKYLNSVIKETLRLHPSAPLLVPRETSERCIVDGYEIPAKTRVIVNAWAIGRDTGYWTEAEKFDPDRFSNSETDYKGRDFEYIPFGAGRRICPGMSFALPNMELPLAQLLYHFDWKLPDGIKYEELDMEEQFGLTVRRKHDLYLIPVPYNIPVSSV